MKEMKPDSNCQIADSLGCILSRARQQIRWDTDDVSVELGIPERWIQYAERDDWTKIPDDAYSRIYFRAYCRFLKLDVKTMMAIYTQVRQRARLTTAKSSVPDRHHPIIAVPQWKMVVTPELIRRSLLGLIGLALIGYVWWAIAGIVTPPKIAVMSPLDGLVTKDHSVIIEGVTDREVRLRINGKSVAPDGHGYFRDTVDLAEGLNTITVSGSKKHSRETAIIRRIIVERDETVPAFTDSTVVPINGL